ncbi:hypothetical protein EYF80_050365 [Liparis tanakae]|uniref:Uncharacterized protein n=1 Tax=Liparis tanakae TaxID=230148 RepID=A0A4Z2FEZ6_9TELE|nr:hypothetical protein EYF80_050365 [Liparis tanakae]
MAFNGVAANAVASDGEKGFCEERDIVSSVWSVWNERDSSDAFAAVFSFTLLHHILRVTQFSEESLAGEQISARELPAHWPPATRFASRGSSENTHIDCDCQGSVKHRLTSAGSHSVEPNKNHFFEISPYTNSLNVLPVHFLCDSFVCGDDSARTRSSMELNGFPPSSFGIKR